MEKYQNKLLKRKKAPTD